MAKRQAARGTGPRHGARGVGVYDSGQGLFAFRVIYGGIGGGVDHGPGIAVFNQGGAGRRITQVDVLTRQRLNVMALRGAL
jgi:hypothetical protein